MILAGFIYSAGWYCGHYSADKKNAEKLIEANAMIVVAYELGFEGGYATAMSDRATPNMSIIEVTPDSYKRIK